VLRLPEFQLVSAQTLADATAVLASEGAAEGRTVRLVAGGTDLWPNMKRRHQKATTVVSLMGIPELRGIRNGGNAGDAGELAIGATTLLDDLARDQRLRARYPALATAVDSISSPPLRNMGTIGGNVCVDTRCTYYNQTEDWRRAIDYCLKEDGTTCWVAPGSPKCLAHSASDSAPVLCALDARVKLVSAAGDRTVPVAGLFRNDGIDYLGKRPDEILTEILLPAGSDAGHCRAAWVGHCSFQRRAVHLRKRSERQYRLQKERGCKFQIQMLKHFQKPLWDTSLAEADWEESVFFYRVVDQWHSRRATFARYTTTPRLS